MSNRGGPSQDECTETDTTFVFADCVELCGYILCVGSIITVCVGIIYFFHYHSIFDRDRSENHSEIIPHNYTGRLSLSLAPDAKPCDNFYQFVCGGWVRDHPNGPPTVFDEIEKQLFREAAYALDAVLLNPSQTKTSSVWKAKSMFYQCHSILITMQDSSKAMMGFLRPRIAFPNIKRMDTASIISLLVELSLSFGIHILFGMEPVAGHDRDDRPVIAFSQSRQLIEWLQLRSRLAAAGQLGDFILSHLKAFPPFDQRRPNSLLESIVQADAMALPQATGDSDATVTTYESLPNLITAINGDTWVNIVNNYTEPYFTVAITDRVIVRGTGAFNRIGKLLTGMNKNNPLLLPTFIGWHLVRQLSHRASLKARVAGYKNNEDHYDACFKETAVLMPLAATRPFVLRSSTPFSKSLVVSLFRDIRRRIAALLKTWMDTPLRTRALMKLQVMQVVVQPDLALNESALDAHYVNFTPHENFFDTWLNATKAVTQQRMAALARGDTLATVELLPIQVKAFYDHRFNTLFIPSGIIRATYADQNLSASLVFAGLGAVIGHEIMHVLDQDEDVRFKKRLTTAAETERGRRTQCLQESYESGHAFMNETVADFTSLRAVYSAFQNQSLLSIDLPRTGSRTAFTEEQMFFLGYCFKLCSTVSSAEMGYSTNQDRCNVPLRNMKEFAAAFYCGPQERMNPAKKCTFWRDK